MKSSDRSSVNGHRKITTGLWTTGKNANRVRRELSLLIFIDVNPDSEMTWMLMDPSTTDNYKYSHVTHPRILPRSVRAPLRLPERTILRQGHIA